MKLTPLALAAAAAILCACNTGSTPGKGLFAPNPEFADLPRGPRGTYGHTVRVETHEPGARVEVNKEYRGITPCTVVVFVEKRREIKREMDVQIAVYPAPTATNQFLQTKSFSGGGKGRRPERLPEAVYFDLRIPPGTRPGEERTINVRVNDEKDRTR